MATLVDINRLLSSITMQRYLNDIQNVFESTLCYLIISVDFFIIEMLKKMSIRKRNFHKSRRLNRMLIHIGLRKLLLL